MVKLLSLLLALCFAVSSCSATDPGSGPLVVDFGDELSQEFRDILFGATSLELVALDPDWPTKESRLDPATLHGYGVRGRATISDRSLRLELLTALGDGARENNGMVAACFNPRHAIVAELEGRTCELIICFECLTFQVWDGSERVETVDVSETPATRFNEIYTAEGLSIAPSY
ncbi:MAG: hypothetical protein P1V81_12430 [Planctomycetota bacterium]|nr:hypothetical protein [Planctomycetota bacterium]